MTQILLWIIDLFPCCLSCQKFWEIDVCQTRHYLKSNNILCTNLLGFHKNSNTSDAIIEFFDYVYLSLESKQSTIAVYLNFSKAFDRVNHNISMSKLLHNGVRGVMQRWFESYLSNRKQFVSLKNCSFSMWNITLGVPKGSVLGPVPFLLCINDMYCADSHFFSRPLIIAGKSKT